MLAWLAPAPGELHQWTGMGGGLIICLESIHPRIRCGFKCREKSFKNKVLYIHTEASLLRSRLMHECVAKRLLREPGLVLQALERLEKLRAANPHGRLYHYRWQELLQGPLVEVMRVMTEASEMADVLRKESPLSAFVLPVERQRIFDSTQAAVDRASA